MGCNTMIYDIIDYMDEDTKLLVIRICKRFHTSPGAVIIQAIFAAYAKPGEEYGVPSPGHMLEQLVRNTGKSRIVILADAITQYAERCGVK